MTISNTPPALPGELYPLLLALDQKVTVLENKNTTPQVFTAPGNQYPITLGFGAGSTSTGLVFGALAMNYRIGATGLDTAPLWHTPGSVSALTPNDRIAYTTSNKGLTLQYKDNTGTIIQKVQHLTGDGRMPACCLHVNQYAIGTNRTFATLMSQGGITTTTNQVTLAYTGYYTFSITASKDTLPLAGGYLWAVKNGTRIDTPAVGYGLYNSSTVSFIHYCTAGDIITFEVSGTPLWDSSGLGFKSNQVTINLLE